MMMKKIMSTFMLLIITSVAQATTGVFPKSVFDNLDYGLYWYGNNDSYEKAIPGHSNSYYNKYSPSVIYVHGWQNNSSKNQSRETWNVEQNDGPNVDLAYAWRRAGYNVGILYWNQFADENEVKDAEAKIWATNGKRQMRWRDSRGNYHNGPSKPASQLLFESVKRNMHDYQGNRVIIAGHSLGNQMALVISKKIQDGIKAGNTNSRLLPKRVALLDPFYSKGKKGYLGNRWTGEVARDYVDALKNDGVVFEAYRSSGVSSTGVVGDKNVGLLNKTAFVELKPYYFGWFDIAKKHTVARWNYFWSYDFSTPSIKGTSANGLSASTSDNRVRSLMNGNKRLIQVEGRYTKTPSDDEQKYANRL